MPFQRRYITFSLVLSRVCAAMAWGKIKALSYVYWYYSQVNCGHTRLGASWLTHLQITAH
jgi:hypothetical protein